MIAFDASIVSATHPESEAVDSFCHPIPATPIQLLRSWLMVHWFVTCLALCHVVAAVTAACAATPATAWAGTAWLDGPTGRSLISAADSDCSAIDSTDTPAAAGGGVWDGTAGVFRITGLMCRFCIVALVI